jgi:predicted permease
MRSLRRFFKRLVSWSTKRRDEARLQEEIEEHLALQTGDYIQAGLSPSEAQRQAVLKFGAIEAIREDYRERSGLPFLETLIQDVRYALRRLRNSPAFAVTTTLTLALGIGATTSIFTLVHAVLLKSLVVTKPGDLYRLGKESLCCYHGGYAQDKGFTLVSYDLYKKFRDNTDGFSELAAFQASSPDFGVRRAGSNQSAQSFPGEFVSGNYFLMFGISPSAGRLFTSEDDRPGAPPVAVMSYRLWQQRYGTNPSVVGSVFDIDMKPFLVVGITPPAFFGDRLRDNPPDFFLPLNTEPYLEANPDLNEYDTHWLDLIGRIRPGANPTSIEAQMRLELKQWLRSHWKEMSAAERAKFPAQTLFLTPGGAGITSMREEYEHWLNILIMVSGFVLLIVCANVANLMLVRAMERRRQTALSMALGAQARRVVRQALTQSLLLSLFGGLAGLVIAFVGTSLILYFAFPSTTGAPAIPIDASPSMPVLLFAFGISVITGLVFGIAPAWLATRVDPIEALRGAGRSTVRTGSWTRKTLVICQTALSLVLLSAAGLLTAALAHLETQDFGFEQARRTVAMMSPQLAGYQPPQLSPLYRRIRDAVSGIPGVSAVALCKYSPLEGNNWGSDVWLEGHPPPGPNEDNSASRDRVTAGYFEVIGNSLLKGRGITERDTDAAPHVAVINEAFARKFFHGADPIGKHFGRDGMGSHQYEIVGVARDARYFASDLGKSVTPMFFLPEEQLDLNPKTAQPTIDSSHFLNDIVIVTRQGASLSSARLSEALASVDPNLPLILVHTMQEQVAFQFNQQTLIARLTSFFGVLSLVLASVGLYGVTAYNAGRRVNEIGVRIALGANRSQVVALILKGSFGLILLGLFIGLPLTFAVGHFLGHQLYGLSPYNVPVAGFAVVVLGSSAFLAALIPAFRASSISPLEALRAE